MMIATQIEAYTINIAPRTMQTFVRRPHVDHARSRTRTMSSPSHEDPERAQERAKQPDAPCTPANDQNWRRESASVARKQNCARPLKRRRSADGANESTHLRAVAPPDAEYLRVGCRQDSQVPVAVVEVDDLDR